MVYRIMFAVQQKSNYGTVYKFDTVELDGEIKYREFVSETELDTYVEYLLNEGGYAKKDFIVVSVKHYNVKSDIFVNPELG